MTPERRSELLDLNPWLTLGEVAHADRIFEEFGDGSESAYVKALQIATAAPSTKARSTEKEVVA